MSFWRMSNGFSASSSVDKILDRDSFTLYDLLADPELVQELLVSNSKLIEYLREPETLDQLVDLIIANVTITTSTTASTLSDEPTAEVTTTTKSTKEKTDISDSEDTQDSTKPLENLDEEVADDENRSHDSVLGPSVDHPESESDEDSKELSTHYASIASEILSADVYSLTNSFMSYSDLLARLWGILDISPLPMTSATFFTKINEHLLDEKTDDMLNFIKNQDKFIQRFMKHIDNPPLMDFLLKVISTDKADNETGIIELLYNQKLIPSLISFLSPEVASSIQSAAGDFLKAFVTISANSNTDNTTIGPNTLSRELVSEPVVKDLVSLMLHGGTGLATGVGIVIEIIRKNNSDYDYVPVLYTTLESHPPTSRDPIYLGTLVKIFSQAIPQFQKMLDRKTVTADGHISMLKTPFGEIEPLGFERFKICELVAELLHCSNMGLLNDEKGENIVRERDQVRESQRRRESVDSSYNDESDFVIEKSDETKNDSDNGSSTSSPTSLISAVEVESRISRLNIDDETISSSIATLKSIPTTLVKSDDEDEEDEEEGDITIPSLDIDAIDAYDSSLKALISTNEEIMTPGNILKLALYKSETLLTILAMFFRFPWNNFLHNVVFDIVQQVLNGPIDDDFIVDQNEENQLHNMENKTNVVNFNKFLAVDLFGRGQLTRKIVDGQKRCDDYEAETGTRMGYMGHLTLISEEVVKFSALIGEEIIANYDSEMNQTITHTSETSDIDQIFEIVRKSVQDPNWVHYVTEILVRTREMYNALLGGGTERDGEIVYHANPNAIILGNGDDDEDEEDETEEGVDDEDEEEEESNVKDQDNRKNNSVDKDGQDRKNQNHRGDMANNGDEYDQLSSSDEEVFSAEEKQQSELEGGRHEQFARYMSEQIGMGVGRADRFGSSDEDEDEEDEDWASQKALHQNISNYNHHNSKSNRTSGGGPELFEDLRDDENEVLRNDEVEYENDEVDGDFGLPFGAGLTRSRSKQDTEWDDEETRRIVGIAMYLQDHENETNDSDANSDNRVTSSAFSHDELDKDICEN